MADGSTTAVNDTAFELRKESKGTSVNSHLVQCILEHPLCEDERR